jgi:Arc/MetJ family transcription regulator
MEHREKWTAELAKNLENLPAAVRDWVREPESDEALLAALVSCIAKEGVVDAGDPLSGGAAATDAHEGTGGIPDPLSGLNTVGEKRGNKRRGADENLFGQVDKMPKTHDFRKPVPLPPLSVRPKAGAILTLGQQARQKLAETFDTLLAWISSEERSQEEAGAHSTFLDGVKQDCLGIKIPEDLLAGGIYVAMYTSSHFPPEGKTEEADDLLARLKGDIVPKKVTTQIQEKERHILCRLISPESVGSLIAAMKTVATATPTVECIELKAALEAVPASLRLLLGLPAPEKYAKQKASSWQKDTATLLALQAAAFKAHFDRPAEEIVEEGGAEEPAEAAEEDEAMEAEDSSAAACAFLDA